jgi:hypothetical protein
MMRIKPMLLAFTLTLLSAPSVVEATEAVPLPTSDPVKSGSRRRNRTRTRFWTGTRSSSIR